MRYMIFFRDPLYVKLNSHKKLKGSVAQKSFIFLFNHFARLFVPSEMVTKENPRKRPSEPPNSASKEVKG